MSARLAEFIGRLDPGDTATVYYAGHGVEIDGENYLLPTDIPAPENGGADFIKLESFSLSELLDGIRGTGARTVLVFLDACRNNPFEEARGRNIGTSRGLGRVAAPQGTFVIFSAGAGQTALDSLDAEDRDPNSVFTRLLLPKLTEPGLELRTLVAQLRIEVRDLARTQSHDQFPAYYDELLGDFYFAAAPAPGTAPAPVEDPLKQIREDFRLANEIGTAEALEGFLARHGTSEDFSVDLARRALAAMRAAGATAGPDSRTTTPIAPVLPLVETPDPATTLTVPAPDAREIVRRSQSALNRLGCDAGGADGLIGNRSRAAFDRYRIESGSGLYSDELGTEAALRELEAATGTVCTAVAVAPAAPVVVKPATPGPAVVTPAAPAPAPAAKPPAAAGEVDISGTWQMKWLCAPARSFRATATFSAKGGNAYSVSLHNDDGENGVSSVTVKSGKLRGWLRWPPRPNETITVTLAGSGRSGQGSSSAPCSFTMSR
jgi:hypothetical protein